LVTFLGHFQPKTGYGNAAIETGKALARLGRVELINIEGDPDVEVYPVSGDACAMTVPSWWPAVRAERRMVGFTMNEATRLPEEFVVLARTYAEAIIVPCAHCAEVFRRETGHPVFVVPLGVDGGAYPLLERGERDQPYTFLWSGVPGVRKGWDVAYRAFRQAFGNRCDVQLVLHFRDLPRGMQGCTDSNVVVLSGAVTQYRWMQLLHEADCFVFPARGEGWGLPPREAAATGLPVIATRWGGLDENLNEWAYGISVARMVPASFGPWEQGEIGEWAEPDADHLVELMRWCEEHRKETALTGRHASAWVHEHLTWEQTARGILDVMEAICG
jgi:glycosyltransferase involved in cell wall biosynthesis